jgi:hypothetical protein
MTWNLGSERGAVLVIVTAFMVAAIALVTLVIDVGHWFEHKRHLQAQVDAGALAAGGYFNGCFGTDKAAANQTIENVARKYAGATNSPPTGPIGPTGPPVYNAQVNNQANVTVLLNSTNYAHAGGTNNSDPAGSPCAAGYIDVKATDANVPWFFAKNLVPAIDAHARVSALQIGSLNGSLPLAIEDVNPLAVGALFVNEDIANFKTTAAAVLATQALTAGAAQTLNGQNLVAWTGGPRQVSIPSRSPESDIGVVIALCSNQSLCGPSKGNAWLSGTVSAVCSQLYVTCDASNQSGLQFIHAYSTTGTGSSTAPIVRNVTLTSGGSGGCTDDSAPYFLLNAGCKVGAQAEVDFGVGGDPSRTVAKGGLGATVKVGGCSLSWVSTTGTTSAWSKSACITVSSGAGQDPLDLVWSTTAGGTHTVPEVARPFASGTFFTSSSGSYPVAYAQISRGAGCAGGVGNSVPFGTNSFCVGVGILGNLKVAADTTDPTQLLKFIGGDRTGAIDCGWGTGANALRDAIQFGCKIPVQRNSGEVCPNATSPVDCLQTDSGGKVGPTRQGMNARFAPGNVCPANNWNLYPNLPSGDPRVVPLIITLYGAIAGAWIPVTDFAAFYVTGWDGAPGSCNGINESAPSGAGNGTIWGHFIVYVGDLGNSTGGSTCTFSASLSPCIPVLTQ